MGAVEIKNHGWWTSIPSMGVGVGVGGGGGGVTLCVSKNISHTQLGAMTRQTTQPPGCFI